MSVVWGTSTVELTPNLRLYFFSLPANHTIQYLFQPDLLEFFDTLAMRLFACLGISNELSPGQLSPSPLEDQLLHQTPSSCLNSAPAADISKMTPCEGALTLDSVVLSHGVPVLAENDQLWGKYSVKYWVKARVSEVMGVQAAANGRPALDKDQLLSLAEEVMSRIDVMNNAVRGSEHLVHKYVMKYVCKVAFKPPT